MIKERYNFRDFLPLIVIFAFIVIAASLLADDLLAWMRFFMAGFFLVFGFLKVIKLSAFAEAYAMYDLLAMRSQAYGFIYPFIELGLGFSYALNYSPVLINWITIVLMLFSALGVYLKLRKKEKIICACLGTVFKVPMTWVTLFEDLLMAGMAAGMLWL